MNEKKINKRKILEDLLSNKSKYEDESVISFVLKSTNMKEAVKRSFLSESDKRILHSHQERVGRVVLKSAYEYFSKKYFAELLNCSSFNHLFQLIDNVNIFRFGKLAKYDVALRLALYLEKVVNNILTPNEVYLYGFGPRNAYKLIFNKRITNNSVKLNELQNYEIGEVIVKSNLKPWEIEVLLCDFHRKYEELKKYNK